MQIVVNPSDELPIYRQIMRQITEAIAGGRLSGGDRLASHRELSEQLVVAPLTVKKAYDELEALGFIETQRGRGTFVCATLPVIDRAAQLNRIHQGARQLLSQAYLAGLRFPEVVQILKDADRDVTGRPRQEKVSMTPVLEFADISRSYKQGVPVLDGVSFSMAGAEVVGLLGRNGAGKTTLFRIAMGMLYPHGGSVRVFGLSPTEQPVVVKKRVGYVGEDQVLPPGSTITDLVAFHRLLFRCWDESLERQLVERFALPRGSRIRQLSKGQARQAALLCAVCHRPELLLLDEPAGGLDPAARREFLETSIQLLNREGTAILFSSHHMSDVERIGGRVVLLDGGKVRLDSDLDRVREDVCVAMIPRSSVPDSGAIERIPGCLRVRPVFDDWHAVVEGAPETARRRLEESLGIDGIRCVRVPLEELFIEMVGGER